MPKMTRDEALAFLRETVHTGHLATVRADGRPHVATIWYLLDEDGDEPEIVFTTWHTSVKGKNIARTGYAALSVTDDTLPFTHVALDGPCTMNDDPSESRTWAAILGGRYMGADRAEEFGERNGVPGEYVCRLKIAHITGMSRVTE
jgi:PPOX class probable F420-dependent enzyme